MSSFPSDILYDILSRLPAKFVFRLRAVCKYWKRIIDDPLFVKLHTKIQQSCGASSILIRKHNGGRLFSLSLDRLNCSSDDAAASHDISMTPLKQLFRPGLPRLSDRLTPSCNGLILITHHYIYSCWAIWNPLTQDFHQVTRSPNIHPPFKFAETVTSGFGYDEASDDYKVVRVDSMYRNDTKKNVYRTLVYSLKSRCWRAVEGFPGGDCVGRYGAFVGGALHWRFGRLGRYGDDDDDGMIIALHLGREDHSLIAVPPFSEGRYWNDRYSSDDVYALDGCLMLSYSHRNRNGMDVWVMKEYGTDKQAWTKLFSVVVQDDRRVWHMSVVAYLKSKGQVLLQYERNGCLEWLDIDDKSSKEITILVGGYSRSRGLSFCQFGPPSLVRLDNTKTGAKRKRKRKKKTKDDDDEGVYARTGKNVSLPCVSSSNFIILPPSTNR